MYEVKHRSIQEHEILTQTLERENIYRLTKAKDDICSEIQRQNIKADVEAHKILKGGIFQKSAIQSQHISLLGYLGVFCAGYSYMPLLVKMLGPSLSYLGLSAVLLKGVSTAATGF